MAKCGMKKSYKKGGMTKKAEANCGMKKSYKKGGMTKKMPSMKAGGRVKTRGCGAAKRGTTSSKKLG